MTRIKLVITGHVDHGKSTLIGRLLLDAGRLPPERVQAVADRCRELGRHFEPAFLLDALEEEQSQNITIDLTRLPFETAHRKFEIIDAPGHREFLRNMISGAADADAAVLIVDAVEGPQEQTRRHVALLALLEIETVVVAITKMGRVDWSTDRFEHVLHSTAKLLSGFGIKAWATVPIDSLDGSNVSNILERPKHITGPSLIDVLESLKVNATQTHSPRFLIQGALTPVDGTRVASGQLVGGPLRSGDRVRLEPEGLETVITGISRYGQSVDQLKPGAIGELTFAADVWIRRGTVVVNASDHLTPVTQLSTRIFWFDRAALVEGDRLQLRLGSAETAAVATDINSVVDAGDLASSADRRDLPRDALASVTWKLETPLVSDNYQLSPAIGRLVVLREGRIVGGGIVASTPTTSVTQQGWRHKLSRWLQPRFERSLKLMARMAEGEEAIGVHT